MGNVEARTALHCITFVLELENFLNSLQAFKAKHLGSSYTERVVGTGKVMDTELGVNTDVEHWRLPGDDKPKSIVFPDPAIHHRAVIPTPGF